MKCVCDAMIQVLAISPIAIANWKTTSAVRSRALPGVSAEARFARSTVAGRNRLSTIAG